MYNFLTEYLAWYFCIRSPFQIQLWIVLSERQLEKFEFSNLHFVVCTKMVGQKCCDKRMNICPRLIDYLVIVGSREANFSQARKTCSFSQASDSERPYISAHTFCTNRSELLRRYPSSNHDDFVLPPDVVHFCQPDGCTVSAGSMSTSRDATNFVFTLTEKDSNKLRYGISLNFMQPFDARRKVAEAMQSARQSQSLTQRVKAKRRICNRFYSLVSLCIISHHPFFTKFRQLLCVLRRLVDCCNEQVSLKMANNNALVRDGVWAALLGLWHENIPTLVMDEIRQLETWILKLLSAPVPVPGLTRVELQVLPPDISEVMTFALPNYTRFTLVDFPLYLLIELLGSENAMTVLLCIMLENKVLFQSRDYNAVSLCVLAAINLLYPMEYLFPVIPLLPPCLTGAEQLLLAPTPFVIGIPASFFEMRQFSVLPTDIVFVDLDSSKVTIPKCVTIPVVPEPDRRTLLAHFNQAVAFISTPPGNNPNAEASSPVDTTGESSCVVDPDEIDINLRIAMVRFFNSPNILGNFSEHTRTLRLYPRPVVALLPDSLIKSRTIPSVFVRDFLQTQAVEYFAECSLMPKNEAYIRVQNGVEDPYIIGDKVKWYGEHLAVINFEVIPPDSSLINAWNSCSLDSSMHREKDDWLDNDKDDSGSSSSSLSSISDLLFDTSVCEFDASNDFTYSDGPLCEVNNVYNQPLTLEVPGSESVFSLSNSAPSSALSSPSSISTCNIDSENDFAKLAQNLALKTDLKVEKSDSYDSANFTPTASSCSESASSSLTAEGSLRSVVTSSSTAITPTQKTPGHKFSLLNSFHLDGGSGGGGGGGSGDFSPANSISKAKLLSSFNSQMTNYAGKTQAVFNEMLKTVPAVKLVKNGPMKKSSVVSIDIGSLDSEANRWKRGATSRSKRPSADAITNKSQLTVKEACDNVLAGHGVGVFTMHRFRRLMEDESLRILATKRLNLHRKNSIQENEYLADVQVSRNVGRGIVRLLQNIISGLEFSFNSVNAPCVASALQVLEIAHSHYWVKEVDASLNQRNVKSGSSYHDLSQSGLTQSFENFQQPSLNLVTVNGNPMPGGRGSFGGPCSQDNAPMNIERGSNRSSLRNVSINQNNTKKPVRPPPPRMSSTSSDEQLPAEQFSSNLTNRERSKANISIDSGNLADYDNTTATMHRMPIMEKCYLYEELLMNTTTSLWCNMQFWENVFYDTVSQERDVVGMDQEPCELIERYASMSESDRKRLELEEDKLLTTVLHNMCAVMLMVNCPKQLIQQKIRRLIGKAHVGLLCSQEINSVLDRIHFLKGNSIQLKACSYQLVQKHTFTVHSGSDIFGDMMFLEVSDEAIMLRGINGSILERWWFEQLVNMTYSPKTKVVCLWRRNSEGKVSLNKFYCKKCRSLYTYAKSVMEKAAAKGKVALPGKELCGEFPIQDIETNQNGLLNVRIDGLIFTFADVKWFVDLVNIKKCNTYGGNIFILEEFRQENNQLITKKYFSPMHRSKGPSLTEYKLRLLTYLHLTYFMWLLYEQQTKFVIPSSVSSHLPLLIIKKTNMRVYVIL
ncbi:MAP kinase-activating death domain protein [Trichinella sp. T6]|nr:MAP kinase-activating death domain protein [Trichinella sp. T6]